MKYICTGNTPSNCGPRGSNANLVPLRSVRAPQKEKKIPQVKVIL